MQEGSVHTGSLNMQKYLMIMKGEEVKIYPLQTVWHISFQSLSIPLRMA